jgi:omega-amidase
MKVTIVQPSTVWENKEANLINLEQLLFNHYEMTDLVVLPEMFTTGFSLNAGTLAEQQDGRTKDWLYSLVLRGKFAICGSFIVISGSNYYNRFLFIDTENGSYSYDKRHLFGVAGETKVFTHGNKREIINYCGFRIFPIICYDLRFPVWCRNRGEYDLLICVASWPDVRRDAWKSLLRARAIENQCYVVGVNRTGTDNEGYNYAGDSVIIDPAGKILVQVDDYEQGSATADISLTELQSFRERLPFLKDSDDFEIHNTIS